MPQLAVSFCNASHTAGRVLGLFDTATTELVCPDLGRADLTSACGLAADTDWLYCASTGPDASYVSLLDYRDFRFQRVVELPEVRDVHSIALDGNALIAVSTGTDSVLRIDMETMRHEVVWRIGAGETDTHHLNAVTWFGDHLLCSGFGPKSTDRWSSAIDGYIYDITANSYVATGLYHPHSLASFGEVLYVCESSYSRVRTIDMPVAALSLSGYVRGLAFTQDGAFAVGSSVGRHDASLGDVVLNSADDGEPRGRCAIRMSDSIATQDGAQTFDLSSYANEIYDIFIV
ncbi:MAG TPA: DUF4915 domain-containing protein [Candidatus Dormibacteraeota bacterium]|nr:DUF4915 domain-containing protein [Candidatus Dormibacteraeota bacterium]